MIINLASAPRDEGAFDESECFIDPTFASAKGGGDEIGPSYAAAHMNRLIKKLTAREISIRAASAASEHWRIMRFLCLLRSLSLKR